MRTAPADLLDVNVWVALADRNHVHHGRARRYWDEESGRQVAFCRISMLGLLRLGTNPRVMGGEPFSPAEIWRVYRGFRAIPEVILVPEPADLEQQMAAWSDRSNFAVSAWTDCYLASLAHVTGCRLVSLDRGFARFDGLDFIHLQL